MSKNWEAAYQGKNTPWDKGNAAPPLRMFLANHSITGQVCVPGCGAGYDVRLLAEQENVDVLGLDIAPTALSIAEQFEESRNVSYEVGDFLSLDVRFHRRFDWVFEHTCLCAIDPSRRADYAESVRLALKPCGYLLAIFFKKVSSYDGEGPPHPISDEGIETLFGKDFELVKSFVPEMTYPSRPFGCEELQLLRKR